MKNSILAVGLAILCFLSILLLGGASRATSLIVTIAFCLFLAIMIPSLEDGMDVKELAVPSVFYFLLIMICLGSLQPGFTSQHDAIWALVGRSGGASVDTSSSIIELIKLAGLVAPFGCGYLLSRSGRLLTTFFAAWAPISIAYSFCALFAFVWAPATIMGFGVKAIFLDRLTASFLSPNTAGTFFGMSVVLSAAACVREFSRTRRSSDLAPGLESTLLKILLPLLSLSISFVCLLMTASRSAALSTSVALAIFFISITVKSGARITKRRVAVFGLIGTCFFCILLASGGYLIERLSIVQTDAWSREFIYKAHALAIRQSLFYGFGFGTFREINNYIINIDNYQSLWTVGAMHNVYMNLMESIGIIGCLPALGLFVFFSYRMIFKWPYDVRYVQIQGAIIAISVLISVHSITDFALEDYSVAALWSLLLGIGYGVSGRSSFAGFPGRRVAAD